MPIKTCTRVTCKRRGYQSIDMGPLRRLIRGGGGGAGLGRTVLQAVPQPQQRSAIARCPVSSSSRVHRERATPAAWRRLGGREAGPINSYLSILHQCTRMPASRSQAVKGTAPGRRIKCGEHKRNNEGTNVRPWREGGQLRGRGLHSFTLQLNLSRV